MNATSTRTSLYIIIGLVVYLFASMVVLVDSTWANGRDLGKGYFFNRTLTSGFNVIQGGIPESAIGTNKEAFINFVEGKWYESARYGGCPGNGCDYPGSAYIIQTMRGPDAGGNWDQSFPSAGAITDWKEKIRNPQIEMRWGYEGAVYGAGITTDRFTNGGERDVAKAGGATSGKTVVFYNKVSGEAYYMLRESCANPLGNMNGLPPLPATDYSLTPSVAIDRTAGESGEPVVVTPTVDNSGSVTSTNTYWSLSTMSLEPGTPVPAGLTPSDNGGAAAVNTAKPCQFYASRGANDCKNEAGTTGTTGFAVGTTTIGSITLPVGDYVAGTKVCYALSVYSYNEATGANQRWAHSGAICLVVAKKPKVQVQGGDLVVGKTYSGVTGAALAVVKGSTTNKNVSGTPRTFGSWVEYGIFATGAITGIGSSSAYAAPGMQSATVCRASILSFTNAGSSLCGAAPIGGYQTTRTIPDVAKSFAIDAATPSFGTNPTINLASPGVQKLYTASGNVTITGGAIGKGEWIVLNAPNATVTITGNITYTSELLQSVGDIPQVVIIAKNINIIDTVTQVDAWLIAKGTVAGADGKLNTCSTVAETAQLTIASCNRPLVVNGPVMAQSLLLRRTAGSGAGAASDDPAEIFNLRPDAYLWAGTHATGNGRVQTVYMTELPPRL